MKNPRPTYQKRTPMTEVIGPDDTGDFEYDDENVENPEPTYTLPVDARYIDSDGRLRIGSGVGMRNSPISGKRAFHRGIDISTRGNNSPIHATIGGRVLRVYETDTTGKAIEVLGKDGREHRYFHLDRHMPDLEVGNTISRGQHIGWVGTTGRSTGPHLHYEIHDRGQWSQVDGFDIERSDDTAISGDTFLNDAETYTQWRLRGSEEGARGMPEEGNLNDQRLQKWMEYRSGLHRWRTGKGEEIISFLDTTRTELEELVNNGQHAEAAEKLQSLYNSENQNNKDVAVALYYDFATRQDEQLLVGLAARLAAAKYKEGAERREFYGHVVNGLDVWNWLDNGNPIPRTTRDSFEDSRREHAENSADINTRIEMAQDFGVDEEGNPVTQKSLRDRIGWAASQYALRPLTNWLSGEDTPVTPFDSTGAGSAPGMAGTSQGYGQSLRRQWQRRDIPAVPFSGMIPGGMSDQEVAQAAMAYQNHADQIGVNIRTHELLGNPSAYGFGDDDVNDSDWTPIFGQRARNNAPRIDPTLDSITPFLDFDNNRESSQEAVRQFQSSTFSQEEADAVFNRDSAGDMEPMDKDELEDIVDGDYIKETMTDDILKTLKESLDLESLPVAPRCLILARTDTEENFWRLKEGGIASLNEGGVAGHMNHLYDNPNLTFRKMKEIFQAASNGELKGTEKTDGQNLQLSYDIQTSSARAARNKGNIRDGGMDAAGLATKFGGRGALETAFTEAFAAFETAIGRMSIEEREEIFGPNTNVYYNAEVQDPRAANLINYDLPTLTIHRVGHREYDRETGSATERDVSRNAKKLSAALDRVQGERQEGLFHVQMNAIRQLEALSDNTALNLATARLERALSEAGISDNQTVGEYVISKVDAAVDSRISLPVETKVELMKRMFKEPGANIRNVLGMIPKEDAGTIAVVRELVAEAPALMTVAVAPIEEIVHDFSVEMLKGLHSAFILDNESEVERLRQETSRAITAIEGSSSEEAMEILAKQMSKLKDVEGVSTAAEGFVFDYDDVTYKFTGNFAPMNQLLGLFKYGRGDVPPMQKLDEEEGEVQINRTVAIVPGGFKPPHKGHLALVMHYANSSDVVYIFISPLPRGAPGDEAEVTFSQSKQIWNLYLDAAGLSNVKVIDRPSSNNSPVQMAYEFSENKKDEPYLAQPGDRILFGASEKADSKGKPDWMRFQNAQKYVRDGAVAGDPAEFASPVFFDGLSATDFRKALYKASVEEINEFLPKNVDSSEILSILGIDPGLESPIEEMSSMAGGPVGGYPSPLGEDDSLIREEDGIIEEVLNYLLQKRNSND